MRNKLSRQKKFLLYFYFIFSYFLYHILNIEKFQKFCCEGFMRAQVVNMKTFIGQIYNADPADPADLLEKHDF